MEKMYPITDTPMARTYIKPMGMRATHRTPEPMLVPTRSVLDSNDVGILFKSSIVDNI
jgi:hypothetical protein